MMSGELTTTDGNTITHKYIVEDILDRTIGYI